MPSVSIIVPVYNVEKYLPKCIESIMDQTFTDFELLLIDDGSPDNSGKICDEYGIRDSRIRVFHTANRGVSSARNLGIEQAQGKWVTFVDSDDWLDRKCLEICANRFDEADVIRFSMSLIGENSDDIIIKHIKTDCNRKEYIEALIAREAILGVCGGFYKMSLFRDYKIRFSPEYTNGEDWLVQCKLILKSQNLMLLDQALYFYNRANDSSCTNVFKFAQHLSAIRVMNEIIRITEGVILNTKHNKALSKGKCMLIYDFLASKIITNKKVQHEEMQMYRNEASLSFEEIRAGTHSLKETLLLRVYISILGRLLFYF